MHFYQLIAISAGSLLLASGVSTSDEIARSGHGGGGHHGEGHHQKGLHHNHHNEHREGNDRHRHHRHREELGDQRFERRHDWDHGHGRGHHPWHDWYWNAAGEGQHPGYYYDPNFYYDNGGAPSVPYEWGSNETLDTIYQMVPPDSNSHSNSRRMFQDIKNRR